MPDLSLQGLAAFSQIPQQMAANFYAPYDQFQQARNASLQNNILSQQAPYAGAITNAQLSGQQLSNDAQGIQNNYLPQMYGNQALAGNLANQGTQNVLKYLGPQAAAQVALTNAQAQLTGGQASMLPISAVGNLMNGLRSNPIMQNQMLQNLQRLAAQGYFNQPNNTQSLAGGPGYGAPSYGGGPAYGGSQSLAGQTQNYSNPQNYAQPAPNAQPYTLGGPQTTANGAPLPIGSNAPLIPASQATQNANGIGSMFATSPQTQDQLNARAANSAGPANLQLKYNNGMNALTSYNNLANLIQTTPNLDKYVGALGQTDYELTNSGQGALLKDPQFIALNKAYESIIPDFGAQTFKYFTGSTSGEGAQKAANQIEDYFGGKASRETMLNNMSGLHQLLLGEVSNTATQLGRQQEFEQATGYPVNTDFTVPPPPPAATQADANAYMQSLTPQMREKVYQTYGLPKATQAQAVAAIAPVATAAPAPATINTPTGAVQIPLGGQ